jgi:hypothetical protein
MNRLEIDQKIFTMRLRTRIFCMISAQSMIIAMFIFLLKGHCALAGLFAMEAFVTLFLWLDTDPLKR